MPFPESWKCKKCMYFAPKKKEWGLCKRYPPKYDSEHTKSFFPDIHGEDCCGEFKDASVITRQQR